VAGAIQITNSGAIQTDKVTAGNVTILGGSGQIRLIGGGSATTASLKGGTGADTFVGGAGKDTMSVGSGANLFEFFKSSQSQFGGGAGGTHVIQGLTSTGGGGSLYIEGYTLAQLNSGGNHMSVSGGNTIITLADKTSITLVGVTNLSSSSITTTPI
jgi:Ca2+-binding RTX toxin-like protein